MEGGKKPATVCFWVWLWIFFTLEFTFLPQVEQNLKSEPEKPGSTWSPIHRKDNIFSRFLSS